MKYRISISDHSFEIEVGSVSGDLAAITVDNTPYMVKFENVSTTDKHPYASISQPMPPPAATVQPKPVAKQPGGGETVIAPIPGIILSVNVKVGDKVSAGQVVAIMEAMKMENKLTSHISGTVKEIRAPKGTEVSTGDIVLVIG